MTSYEAQLIGTPVEFTLNANTTGTGVIAEVIGYGPGNELQVRIKDLRFTQILLDGVTITESGTSPVFTVPIKEA
ncbi:hypothetical protein SPF06_02490 [Sinomonas sp. JGH33]|uniref:Uncharacterized protein n=1 Tax=Sinomonas terricola TaxID=3110330 RepID=A0ABU5T267_9MICC|nr:hypothetical protein [Sinomonas sp. JGH33]MEA5453581.1 hypothetical protein [Sinomonas sp. JGH33]